MRLLSRNPDISGSKLGIQKLSSLKLVEARRNLCKVVALYNDDGTEVTDPVQLQDLVIRIYHISWVLVPKSFKH